MAVIPQCVCMGGGGEGYGTIPVVLMQNPTAAPYPKEEKVSPQHAPPHAIY